MGHGLVISGSEIADARPKVVSALAAQFRDLDLAEDAFSAAVEALLASATAPENPAAWLYITAKRKAFDHYRRRESEAKVKRALQPLEEEMGELIEMPDPIPDERLRLIFICCHPALAPEARVALTLRTVCGVDTAAIARAFLISEPTMYARLTRAKAKVAQAGIPFETPPRRYWAERLQAVLVTLEVAWSVAYRDAVGAAVAAELAPEVERLALMLADLMPEEPEALGLAATVILARAREAARVDKNGAMVPLSEQEVALWDRLRIESAQRLLQQARAFEEPGPYQSLAAIHFAHASRLESGETPWSTIAELYDLLAQYRPSPVVGINRALAYGRAFGAARGLAELDQLDEDKLTQFLPFHVAKADLLARADQNEAAKSAFEAALALKPGPAEQRYLEKRLADLG